MKKRNYNYILTVLLFVMSSTLFAQQESTFSFYKYHMNMVNPAYVGMDKETLGTSSIRTQWTGIESAPKTQALSFGMALQSNIILDKMN